MAEFFLQHRKDWHDRGTIKVMNVAQLYAYAVKQDNELEQGIYGMRHDPSITEIRRLDMETGEQLTIERLE